ncbi:putative SAM-dependent methyltransferase [Dickeya phage vB_DsoM_JA33]|uniref:ART-PolyVal-like domain-containing protein n=2 Tax=Salmondvirus JA11 TaxID=2734141 RepID=A0A386K5K2_9CAUD|nr:hypothetical protein HOU32_gp190 [Dickeya phage vB_DsoM_JA11]AXG67564.1 putative SAM-dependent methyltransferase [Dickeya phage vB_DsoM_JA33]AYD79995.1 hypothetical protein JA11_190 [Dickeya phage vB_DsoM_JA11]
MELLISLSKPISAFTSKDQAAFDKWFGKSVVKDPQGNPLVVYHGTPGNFDTFDKKRLGGGNDEYGIGFYFTDSAEFARYYTKGSGSTMPVYLKITKPIIFEKPPRMTLTQATKIANGLTRPHFNEFLAQNYDIEYQGLASAKKEYLEDFVGMDVITAGHNLFQDIYAGEPESWRFPEVFAAATGRDGIIAKRGEHFFYVVFSPTQIKSAIGNKGTFKPRTENILE